jgi:hypothetical protein
MQLNADAIFEAAVQLPESERLTLVSKLMETMPDEDLALSIQDPKLVAELDRRSGDMKDAIAWSDLRAEG